MGKYQFIKKLERSGDLAKAVRMGVISSHISRQKDIYESYLKNKKKNSSKMQAYQDTADDCKVSTRYVIAVIRDFEK